MNRRVLLARWLRHYLYAGVENFFTGHRQLRIAATEQDREQFAEMPINLVKGILQQVTCLYVDLVDRILQGIDGFGQICVLRIEEILALRCLRQFIQCGQVHRAECNNRIGQARHLTLQV